MSIVCKVYKEQGWKLVCLVVVLLSAIPTQAQQGCFDANVTRGCAPLTITITDACANSNPQPDYTYGDEPGAIPVLSKTHTYTKPGRYTITQYSNINGNGEILVKENYIEVLPTPEPVFTLSTCSGREVSLELTDNAYNSYLINWGDGSPEESKPSSGTYRHTYVDVNPRTVTVSGRYTGLDCGGSWSLTVNPVASLPKPVINSLTTLDATSARITFQAEAGQVYRIEKRNEATGVYSEVLSLTSPSAGSVGQLLTGPQPATYRVVIVDDCGNRVPSDEISSVVLNATAADGQNLISWQTHSVATFVKSSLNRDGQLLQENTVTTVTTYNDAAISCGETYCYQIQMEFSGSSARSISNTACAKAVSSAIPPPVANLAATVVNGRVVLSWMPPGNTAVREYVVSRSVNDEAYTTIARITGTTYEDADSRLDRNRYCYKIGYFDNCGNLSQVSAESCPVQLQMQPVTDPANEGYRLTWTSYTEWPAGIQLYEVDKIRADGRVIETQTITGNEYFFPLDTANQLIRFRVRAIGSELISESNSVEIRQDVRIFAPDAFTPNGDGINDRFLIRGLFIQNYKITIYNRWGEAVYGSDKLDAGWDGRSNRYTGLSDSYSYVIRVEDQIGRILVRKGSLLLIR